MTMSKTQLTQSCRRSEKATEAYAPVAGDALEQAGRPLLTDEEARILTPGMITRILCFFGSRRIREAREAFDEADLACSRLDEEYGRLTRERDAAAVAAYDQLVDFRKQCRIYMDAKQEKVDLGTSGRTPRQPEAVCRWGKFVVGMVKGHELELRVDHRLFDPAPYVRELEKRVKRLDAALDAVEAGKLSKQVAVRERQLAFEECKRVQLHGSRLVESALGLAGRPDLALKIRGVGLPGRRREKASRTRIAVENAVRRARKGFSRLADAVRRARKSSSSRSRGVRESRQSLPSRWPLVRSARQGFSRLAGAVRRARQSS